MRYWKGYNDGYAEGRLQAISEYERVLALLREEVADLKREREGQSHRADAAVDLLLGHLGERAISLAGEVREVERAERHIKSVQQLTALPDPTQELPYGDPRGLYPSEAAARVDVDEDIGGLTLDG